jgi:hypothetical protein
VPSPAGAPSYRLHHLRLAQLDLGLTTRNRHGAADQDGD